MSDNDKNNRKRSLIQSSEDEEQGNFIEFNLKAQRRNSSLKSYTIVQDLVI
jgi:hypothetical protein